METLDGNVLSKVLAQVPPSQYRAVATTCRAWARAMSERRFWLAAFAHVWGCVPEEVRSDAKLHFIKRYQARKPWAQQPKQHQLAVMRFADESRPVVDMYLSPDRKRLTVVSPSYITHDFIGAPDHSRQERVKVSTFNPFRFMPNADVHGYYVQLAAVSFTPDGGLVLGMYDGVVAFFRQIPRTGFSGHCTLLSSVNGVTQRRDEVITEVTFNTTGQFVASATKYRNDECLCIRVWDVSDKPVLVTERNAMDAVAWTLCEDGSLVWVTKYQTLFWPSRKVVFNMPLDDQPQSVTCVPKCDALLVRSARAVLILHVAAGEVAVAHNVSSNADTVLCAVGHTAYAFAAVHSSAGRIVAHGGKYAKEMYVDEPILAVSLDASVLIVSCHSALLVYDALSWELLRKHTVPRAARHSGAEWGAVRIHTSSTMVLVRRGAGQVHVWNFGAPLAHMDPPPGRVRAPAPPQLVSGCAEIPTTNVPMKARDSVPGRTRPQRNNTRFAAMSSRDLDSALAEMEDEDAAEAEARRLAQEYVPAVMTEQEMLDYAQMLSLEATPGMNDADAEAELRRLLESSGGVGDVDASGSAQSSQEVRDAAYDFDQAQPTPAQRNRSMNNATTGSNSERPQLTGAEQEAAELQAAIELSLREM